MFFSIFLIIFFLLLFLLGTIGYGKLLYSLLFKRILNDNYGEYGLLGLIFISLLSTFIHFFFSIDTNINFIIYFFGLFFAYNFYSEIEIFIKKNKYILSVFLFISFFMVIYHKPNEDFGYYHLPYLINFTSDKIIVNTLCKHSFCNECFQKVLEHSGNECSKCPNCRKVICKASKRLVWPDDFTTFIEVD